MVSQNPFLVMFIICSMKITNLWVPPIFRYTQLGVECKKPGIPGNLERKGISTN